MKITRAVDYGIRGVHYMSMQYQKGEISLLSEICNDQDVPPSFMAKILQALTRAGIVKSFRGVKGGFLLAKSPKDITLKEVMEAIDGPLNINFCLVAEGTCERDSICPVHPVWREVQNRVIEVLDNYDFEYLAKEGKRLLQIRHAMH